MSALDTLQQLSRLTDDDGAEDDDRQRPTPLDPEYWRGITHSHEYAPVAAATAVSPPPLDASYAMHMHATAPHGHMYMPAYAPQVASVLPRPMTAPMGGGIPTSPIHAYANVHPLPISPIATSSVDWGTLGATAMAMNPQALKSEIRDAFVRAQAFADPQALFQSSDAALLGAVPLRAVQEALMMIGVVVSSHALRQVGQLFASHEPGMVDYTALARFLGVDAREWEQLRSVIHARRDAMHSRGIDLGQAFMQNDAGRTGFVPRPIFLAILRDCGVLIPDALLHFLMIELAKPFDSTAVSYTRFLDTVGLGSASAGAWSEFGAMPTSLRSSATWGNARKPKRKFKDGDKVEAQYKGKSKFYPGVISRCRLNGTYDIDYDDGEKETGVAAELIRLRGGSSSPSKKAADSDDDRKAPRKFKEGDKVEAQYKGKSKFYPGVISRCRLNGTYDIDYDDGEKETGVAAELIRLRGGSSSPSKKKLEETSEDDVRGSKKFREGEKVEVQYKGRSKYYPGVVSRCRLNGTYDIDYDDGEKETGVAPELMRSLEQKKSPTKKKGADESEDERKQKKFREGEKVEAQYKGRSKFYPGVISRCRLNGTYDIDYEDGEKETGVAAELIRSRESSSPSKKKTTDTSEDEPRTKKFREGDKVEAQYKGRSKFYPGVISRCRLNGTYDIDYDDGEKETGVAAELIRSRETSSPSKKKKSDDASEDDRKGAVKFREGERVEVQYKGKAKYYPGVIARCRLNGTYDINYDDGEKETGVSAELIRSLEKKAVSSDDDRGGKNKFREGEKVEAQYKGKSKFYPGVISRCRLNGTYDIDYDDGEKESGVAAELIRSRESGRDKDGSGSKKLKEGDKVEAQYKGRSKFYPGVISRCRLNGTYDIDYDDGEKESGVAAELIRVREGSSPKKKNNDEREADRDRKFQEGDKIEAQYKGKSKFYPGVISRCRSNGTYDIDYDDGEKETGVVGELIRLREGASGEKKFREGDKIEAQYKGKSKFYPGIISRCRLNGTYDIDYDDGEKETGVAADLIRLRPGSDKKQAKVFKEGYQTL
ncbi:hypothetical protein P43SY_001872 [Pythium insidiosum]|uniref:SGF29 C-terminal domain-containing protein n=1 Tax=Pythium insidiosum TaxID=114742 RepID=A0AAD5LI27_PYTIN|nr:hypothetical protein P43SY_001872 [Pythium insidiosum]